jgi:hypothetical protein
MPEYDAFICDLNMSRKTYLIRKLITNFSILRTISLTIFVTLSRKRKTRQVGGGRG